MNRLKRFAALMILALWGLAAMHCRLEAVPGLDFLKTCCLQEPVASSSNPCESEGCCAVEDGNYRPEEQTAAVPQPSFVPALVSSVIETPELAPEVCLVVAPSSPPELSNAWRFTQRTALPPRAPSGCA